jgi:hypothetical protein
MDKILSDFGTLYHGTSQLTRHLTRLLLNKNAGRNLGKKDTNLKNIS